MRRQGLNCKYFKGQEDWLGFKLKFELFFYWKIRELSSWIVWTGQQLVHRGPAMAGSTELTGARVCRRCRSWLLAVVLRGGRGGDRGPHRRWHEATEALTWARGGASGGGRNCSVGATFEQREEKWEAGFGSLVYGEAEGALYRSGAALGRQVDRRPLMGAIKTSVRQFHLWGGETKGGETMGWRRWFHFASWREEALHGEACSGATAGSLETVAALFGCDRRRKTRALAEWADRDQVSCDQLGRLQVEVKLKEMGHDDGLGQNEGRRIMGCRNWFWIFDSRIWFQNQNIWIFSNWIYIG
jgi:hypothetical protein